MDHEEIIDVTSRSSGGLVRDAAERAVQATLQTLAERRSRGEARHILQELPAELKPWIYTETDAEALGIDEFLERVAQREGTDVETALQHARAVFAALGEALAPDAVDHLAASLPQTFDPLGGRGSAQVRRHHARLPVLGPGRDLAGCRRRGGPPGH